jgi:hypothetical protein
MATSDEYRKFAEDCLRSAHAAKNNEERRAFLDMARIWTEATAKVTLDKDKEAHGTLMKQLENEANEIDKLVQQLLSEMDQVPQSEQEGPKWGTEGEFAKRFRAITRRHTAFLAKRARYSGKSG